MPITIILPAYNERARLGPALDELFAWLDGPGQSLGQLDVLVVDDGSEDGTADLVRARPEASVASGHSPRLRVLSVPHQGKGAAVRAGMLAGEGDLLLFADADMATPPQEITKLVAALEDADVALGSRIQDDGSDMRASQPLLRRILGKAFHTFASLWVLGPVQDSQCGFKGFNRSVARDLFGMQRIRGFAFDVELIYLARRRGYRMAIVPVAWADRRGSRMRTSPTLALRLLVDLLRIPVVHRRVPRVRATGS